MLLPSNFSKCSLFVLVSNGSLRRCDPTHVYSHHLCTMVPMKPLHHIIYPATTYTAHPVAIRVWATFVRCALGDNFTLCRSPSSPQSWRGIGTVLSFGHWPTSDDGGHNRGCRVDSPLNLPLERWWVAPCQWGCLKQKIAGQSGFSSEHYSSRSQSGSVAGGCPANKYENGKYSFPVPLERCDEFPGDLLDSFDIALDLAVRLRVQGRSGHLVHSRTLQEPPVSDETRNYGPCNYVILVVLRNGSCKTVLTSPFTPFGWESSRPPPTS